MRLRSRLSDGRRGRLRASESVAGWVFADLLLVLFIIGLGTAIPKEPEPPPPPPPPKPEPQIIGMETSPKTRSVQIRADALLGSGPAAADAQNQACRAIRRRTADLGGGKAEAALVMIFAGHPDDANRAQQVSAAIGQQLTCATPKLFPADTFGPSKVATPADVRSGRDLEGVVRPFWDGGLPYGDARLEIYVFTTQLKDQ